jgi:murein DD-endopeptidase MepM/ murein hydrolase activator NlpD
VNAKHNHGFGTVLLLVLLAVVLIPSAWFLYTRLEGRPPVITHDLPQPVLGREQTVTLTVVDDGRGLRQVRAILRQGAKEIGLAENSFPGGLLSAEAPVNETALPLRLNTVELGLSDGPAVLEVTAVDHAWRRWWNGNQSLLELPLTVDTQPPRADVLTTFHYVNQGGAGLVIFRLSEDCPVAGVKVGENFFPGVGGLLQDPRVMVTLFAVAHDQGTDTPLAVEAVDTAGNRVRAGFNHRIKPKRFPLDRLTITDRFIQDTMFGFVPGGGAGMASREIFLKVNRELRQVNYETLTALGAKSAGQMLWDGPFLRLPNAAPRAGFADQRTYLYEGQEIDHQVHLGVDLASLERSPVPAANSGQVVFTGFEGIYGNTVVLDHGLGLLSLYSHLSEITVQVGQAVTKGDILGRTGATGLAAGDHLHFSIIVHNTFVNPIEWWDPGWIQDNVVGKLQDVRGR